MKYFTFSLWNQLNSLNEKDRLLAEQLWMENDKIYHNYVSSIAHEIMSNESMRLYLKHHGFHDYVTTQLDFSSLNPSSFLMELSNKDQLIQIRYSNVIHVSINIPKEFAKCKHLKFGYDEFEVHGTGAIEQRILFNMGLELNIQFEKIEILEVNK